MRYLVTALALAWVMVVGTQTPVFAHNKQLSQKTFCHKQGDSGHHWHMNNDRAQPVAGKCEKINGTMVQVQPPPVEVTIPKSELQMLVSDVAKFRQMAGSERSRAEIAEAKVADLNREYTTLKSASAAAERRFQQAADVNGIALRNMQKQVAEARVAVAEAEARASGAGPAVSSKCKRGVNEALDTSRWNWGDDARSDLRRACLE